MKKLLVATMIACAAAFAQAGAVDWSYYDETSTAGDYTFYIINSAGVSSSLYTMLAVDGDIDGFRTAIEGYDKQTFTADFASDGYIYGEDAFTSANANITIFAVKDLEAGAEFFYSADMSTDGYIYEPPAVGSAMAFDSTMLSSGTIAGSEVIPEPTSGLLLLIGMAGLALRRRRA